MHIYAVYEKTSSWDDAKSRGLVESTNGIYQRYGCLSFQIQLWDWPGVAPPKLCFGLFHCCLKRYVARRQLVSAEYVPRRKI